MNLNDEKVALVIGAGLEKGRPGIGFGCAKMLASHRAGMKVVLCDTREDRLQNALESIGRNAKAIVGNVFDFKDAERIVNETIDTFRRIDVLVTGPASSVNKYVTELSPEEYLKTLSDDLVSHCYLAQLVANTMIKRKEEGRIIFISSIYGSHVRKKHLAYDTAKAALIQATKIFARELGQHGILVNAISPGFTDTPNERLYANDDQVKEIVSGLLLNKSVSTDEIGKLAVFLAETDDMTGQNLSITGGMDLVDYTYDKRERR